MCPILNLQLLNLRCLTKMQRYNLCEVHKESKLYGTVGTKGPATAMRKNAHSYIQKLNYLKSCGIHWRNTLFLKSHQALTTDLSPPASFFLTPLMRAGVDKEVWIVQLLTELFGSRQSRKQKYIPFIISSILLSSLTPVTGHKKRLHALGRAVGVKLPGTCASLSIPQ